MDLEAIIMGPARSGKKRHLTQHFENRQLIKVPTAAIRGPCTASRNNSVSTTFFLLPSCVLLLLLLHQTTAAAGANCPFNIRTCTIPARTSTPSAFLYPFARWAKPARTSISNPRSNKEDCDRSSGSSGVYRHCKNKRSFIPVPSAAASNSHNGFPQREKQQQDDGTPQIDLARALQLLEAASSGGPHTEPEAAVWGPSGSGTPNNNPSQRGMGEKKRLAVIFNCMLHACERQGDALGGFEVYRQMRSTGAPPDEATFHSVASLLERAGEYHGMLKLLEHMEGEGHEPSLAVLGLAISCFSKAGVADAALQRAHQLQRRIRVAAAAAAPSAAAAVAVATAGLQQEADAVAAAAEALQQALPSSVYAALICCCASTGRYDKAIELYSECAALRQQQEVLHHRMTQQKQRQRQEQQQQQQQQNQESKELEPEVLQHLQQLLHRDSYLPTAAVTNAAITAAAATGRLQLAMTIYRRDLLQLQVQQQQHGQDQLSEEIFGTCSAAEAHAPSTHTYLLLLAAAAAQQSWSTVDVLLRDFEEQQQERQQQQLPPLDTAAVYAAAAEALAAGGRWREALQLLLHSHADWLQQQKQAIQKLKHLISMQHLLRQQQPQQPLLLQAFPPSGSVSPYLALLRCCTAAAAPRESLGLLRLLQQRYQQQQQLFVLQKELQEQQQDSFAAAAAAIPPEFPLSAYAEVMTAAAAAGDWQLLLSVAAEFESPKIQQQNAAVAAATAAVAAASARRTCEEPERSAAAAAPAQIDGAAAAAAAARATAALSQQHIPLEQRVRVAALKLKALLHVGNHEAAANQRQKLLLLLEDRSTGSSTSPQSEPADMLMGRQQKQQAPEDDPLVNETLKLGEKLLGPPHHQQKPGAPPLPLRERDAHEELQRQKHQEIILQQIQQHKQHQEPQ